jgi:calcium-dependent protein kinase
MVDLPSHWAEVSRALQPASSDASSGDAALDFGAFVARMKALALSRPHEVDLFQRKRGEQLVSNGDCLRRLGEGLNRSIEGLCREVYAVVSHAAALRLYDLGDVLGEGGFGSVRLITARQSKRTYALKLIPKVSSRASEACEELRIMQAVSPHPHIISLVDAFEQLDAYCLVLELAEGGPLFERLAKSGAYAERDASGVLRQVASALAHLHRLDITHRDLKPENLLLRSASGEPSIALCDFGLSGSGELRGICGTLPYMAPEILKGVVYSYEVDIWALGVVLYNVLSGHQPFDPAGTADSVTYEKRIASCSWSFDSDPGWGGVSAPAKALLSGLLQLDPARRLTAQQILEVPWVRGEASATPLPAVARQLSRLTEDRLVWHAAMRALVLIVNAPSAAVVGGSAAPPPSSTAATAELRAAFDLMDRNRDGHIDGAELRQLLRSLGAQEHEIEQVVARTLSAIDVDGDARISFEEYCVGVAPLFTASTEALRTAFRLFDTDGSGRIDRSEFAQMLCKLGLPVGSKPEDMERIFASADADGDGEISFAEFYALACSGAVEHDGDQRMGGLLSAVSSSL